MTRLIMPNKYESITVKIIDSPYTEDKLRKGEKGDKEEENEENIYCDVIIWGDVRRDRIFKMLITKTLWHSLYRELVYRFELGGDIGEEIDSDLKCLSGRVITIRGISDFNRSFQTKSRNIDNPKIFDVKLREDLEDIERLGGEEYVKRIQKELSVVALENLKIIDDKDKKKIELAEKIKRKKIDEKDNKVTKIVEYAGW